jgi:acyl-CoA dehydrogenase
MVERHRDSEGRRALIEWRRRQPENAYLDDTHFRHVLAVYAGERLAAIERDLVRFGAEVAGPVDALVRRNNLFHNNPQLERFDGVGVRTERIEHHPAYHEAGRFIYGSGVMEAYGTPASSIAALARFYVSSYNGEAGHNCPLACTAGVIRVLQELGTAELKDRFLPGLVDRDYDRHLEGAQFLTEIQGGSDVGANATRAIRDDTGTWRIHGEKWFCSNIDADLFLMTARPDGAPDGTRGLGLFLVPRSLQDGSVNGFHIRRLKDKLGTRSMASGECDFDGAVAWPMGDLGDGFKNMMSLVINTSRIYNATSCCGSARRAYVTAQTYAEYRRAFDHAIVDYPLVQETLADTRAEVDAMVSGTFHEIWLQDRVDAGQATENERGFLRMAVNLNKMRTAKSNREAVVNGIEILGGNGAIETFSVLPRLLRDAIVSENWEGTHNTLIMQVLRDCEKYRVHQAYFAYLEGLLDEDGIEPRLSGELRGLLTDTRSAVETSLLLSARDAPLELRPLLDRACYLFHAVVRLWERSRRDGKSGDDPSLEHFLDRRLRPGLARDDAYYLRIATLARSR